MVTKRLYGKEREWSIGQIKTCRKKQHVKIDDMKEMSDLICGKAAVGGNYNSTRDTMHRFMEEQGYALDITDRRMHHEIYLSDARKVAPEKLKTAIRHPIKRA